MYSFRNFIKTALCYTVASLVVSSNFARAQTMNISTQEIYITKICEVIIKEALASIALEVKLLQLPTARAAFASNNGQTDGEICRIKGFEKKYQNLIIIEPSIIELEASVFTHNIEIPIETDNWQALKPYTLGIHIGHLYASEATRGFTNIVRLVTDEQAVKMLARKRLEAAVMIKPDALKTIKDLALQDKVTMLEPILASYPLHFFIHKKNAHLKDEISKAIKIIVDSGRAQDIYRQYLAELNR